MQADNTDEVIGVTNCNAHVTESFEVSISTTPIPSSHDPNSSGDSKEIGPGKAEVSTPFIILPEDPEEKRKHIIGLVLEQFPYLYLRDSDERGDRFSLNSSALCPIIIRHFYDRPPEL
ncbi:unnamed protein product [Rhizophagus irregularis]|uniref:Uncharacterized protein n=1 Tax=Rhizophagus irregularis TaxID=588596 RepID=A0A2I1H9A6_9GLOM|nr:hypothetical protein RhiirA4_474891 [Rhizophagus irregularis]CAB4431801.1 unnamed protein product [Rhizophagus irregularis]